MGCGAGDNQGRSQECDKTSGVNSADGYPWPFKTAPEYPSFQLLGATPTLAKAFHEGRL